jgi:hypothetical protein
MVDWPLTFVPAKNPLPGHTSKSSGALHRAEDSVLLEQVVNDRLLVSIDKPENSRRKKVSRGGSGSMAGACLRAECRSTETRLSIVRRHSGLKFPRQGPCDRFDRPCRLRSYLGRFFAPDAFAHEKRPDQAAASTRRHRAGVRIHLPTADRIPLFSV